VIKMNRPAFNGRIEYNQGIAVTYSSYLTKDQSRETWEQHRTFIDMHIVLEGNERIGLLQKSGSRKVKEYSALRSFVWVGYN